MTDRLVRIGVALFAVGFAAIVADVVPFLFGAENRPTWLNVVAILGVTLGLGCALVGLGLAVRSPASAEPEDDVPARPVRSREAVADPVSAPPER